MSTSLARGVVGWVISKVAALDLSNESNATGVFNPARRRLSLRGAIATDFVDCVGGSRSGCHSHGQLPANPHTPSESTAVRPLPEASGQGVSS